MSLPPFIVRCWPTWRPRAAPPPVAAPAPATHHHTPHSHVWGLRAHRPASRIVLVYAGLSCVVIPGALGLAGSLPWWSGPPPQAPPVVIGAPYVAPGAVFAGIPPGIIGQQPVVAVPEPSSLWLLAGAIALTLAIYWSGFAFGLIYSSVRHRQ